MFTYTSIYLPIVNIEKTTTKENIFKNMLKNNVMRASR